MGFLDDVSNAVDRGAAAVGRTTKTAQLKMQLSDLSKRRREIAAQLGASLYEATKNDAALRSGREELYDSIASLDRQCGELNTQIRAIEAGANVRQTQQRQPLTCPQCGAAVAPDDLFCGGCGIPAEQVRAAYAQEEAAMNDAQAFETAHSPGTVCPNCGSAVARGDRFCMSCGQEIIAGEGFDTPPITLSGNN